MSRALKFINKVFKGPRKIPTSTWKELPRGVKKGIERQVKGESPFTLMPVNWVAKGFMKGTKAQKQKKVNQFWWKHFQKPVMKADVTLGAKMQKGWNKVFGEGGQMFQRKMVIPEKKGLLHKFKRGHGTGGKEVYVPSATKPLSAAAGIIVPIAGSMKIEEGLKKYRERKRNMNVGR